MSKKTETKDVVTTTQSQVPDYIKQGQARGSEGVEMGDLTIPRLEIVQALSPCRKKTDAAYIEGAEEGVLYNNVTRELYGTEVYVVPITFKKEFLIWKDRKAGGGFRGAFPSQSEANEYILQLTQAGDNGPFEAADTPQHFCLMVELDETGNVATKVSEIVISMPRTKIKVSKQWNSMIRINGGDRFSRVYKVSSVADSSEKGDYFNFKVTYNSFAPEAVYKAAEKIYEDISAGKRNVEVNRDVDEPEVNIDTEKSEF